MTFPCHSETEPEVQALLVSDITPESFKLAWEAEEDSFDTFVVMVSQSEGTGQPQELVLGGEERNAALAELTEDTEYKVEIFGLVLGRRSKSVKELVRTGIRPTDGNGKSNLEWEFWTCLVSLVSVVSFVLCGNSMETWF